MARWLQAVFTTRRGNIPLLRKDSYRCCSALAGLGRQMGAEGKLMASTLNRSHTMPLPLGTVVKPWGRIDMIGITGGERYYWLVDGNIVSMIPATMVESAPIRDKGVTNG